MEGRLSSIDLRGIARDAGFPEDFDLELYAASALAAFQHARKLELQRQRVKSQRKTLKSLARDSGNVATGLQSLQSEVLEALLDRQIDLPGDLVRQLPNTLHMLSESARGLLDDETDPVRGAPPEAGLNFAIKELYAVYKDWYPNEVGYFRKDESECGYEGKFYHLVRLLLPLIRIEKTPQAIGKAIERALSE